MRIVAGEFRSRILKAVDGDATRPTTDKVKEAIFSRIGPYFDGGKMLDVFGGSGNMGLEAISRGMHHVTFCDMNAKAIQTIEANMKALQVEARCTLIKSDYKALLRQCAQQGKHYNLIYLDPPYKKQQIDAILTYLHENKLVAEHGDVVCESLKEDSFKDAYGDLIKVKDVTYGITRITYYKKGG